MIQALWYKWIAKFFSFNQQWCECLCMV